MITLLTNLTGNLRSNGVSFKKTPESAVIAPQLATPAAGTVTSPITASLAELNDDVFEKVSETTESSSIKKAKTRKTSAKNNFEPLHQSFLQLKKEKVIPEELFVFLEPIKNSAGEKEYSPLQVKLIDAAQKRMNSFMEIADTLAKEGEEAGDQVYNQMFEIFGGEDGLGQYLKMRTKSKKSIFNKLVKELKDEKFYGQIMDRFAKDAFKKPYSRLTPNDYKRIADSYFKGKAFTKEQYDSLNKPYDKLSKDEKKLLTMAINEKSMSFKPDEIEECIKMFKPGAKEYEKAVTKVRDLVGTRLILPSGSPLEMEEVEKYLSKAIRYNKIKITKMSNYHDNYILPYIKYSTAQKWKDAMPGMVLVGNSKVRKRNGYTTTQFNITHPIINKEAAKAKDLSKSKISKKAQNIEKNKLKNKFVFGELQIRTKKLNDIGQIEHLIYDILEDKDISQGIPELRKYYDSIGIEDAVNAVFNDDRKEENYIRYENSMYYWTRHNETRNKGSAFYAKPRLANYELKGYEILGFDSLAKIDKEANRIKKLYKNKSQEKE